MTAQKEYQRLAQNKDFLAVVEPFCRFVNYRIYNENNTTVSKFLIMFITSEIYNITTTVYMLANKAFVINRKFNLKIH